MKLRQLSLQLFNVIRSPLKPCDRRISPNFQAPRVQMCLNNLYPNKTVGQKPHDQDSESTCPAGQLIESGLALFVSLVISSVFGNPYKLDQFDLF